MKDKLGNDLKVGDIVHNKWGYDLIVMYDDATSLGWYGKLVCEKGHSCENIPYALVSEDIIKLYPYEVNGKGFEFDDDFIESCVRQSVEKYLNCAENKTANEDALIEKSVNDTVDFLLNSHAKKPHRKKI